MERGNKVKTTDREKFENEVIELVRGIIPGCYVYFSKGAFGKDPLLVFATSKEWANNIIHNDPGHTHIWFWGMFTPEGELREGFSMESGGHLIGYSNWETKFRNKCGWRDIKKDCTIEKCKKALAKYFTAMKECIEKDKGA